MKTSTPHGFTLLEALLALLVFSTAVIALVEAINTMGTAAVESRKELQIQGRLETLLMEITRDPMWLKDGRLTRPEDKTFREGDVTYQTKVVEQELQNKEGETLKDLFKVTVQARWKESGIEQEQTAETWTWPPLFVPQPR